VKPEAFQQLSKADKVGLCANYKNEIKSILASNELVMSNLLSEKIAITETIYHENKHTLQK
jgi:hypothetical protein